MSKISYLSNTEFKAKGACAKAPILKASTEAPAVLEGRQIKFVLSAPVVDRDFDLIDPKGIDCGRYRQNPVVFLNHEHHSLPIGKCVMIGLEDGALVGTVEFVSPDVPVAGPVAEAVCQLCRAGVLNAVSIGFLTREWEFAEDRERRENGGADIRSCELLEFSVVGIKRRPEREAGRRPRSRRRTSSMCCSPRWQRWRSGRSAGAGSSGLSPPRDK